MKFKSLTEQTYSFNDSRINNTVLPTIATELADIFANDTVTPPLRAAGEDVNINPLTPISISALANDESIVGFSVSEAPCPHGWTPFMKQKCYKYHYDATLVTFYEAMVICEDVYNATMISIHTPQEQLFLNRYIRTFSTRRSVWLGAIRKSSHSFRWLDGTPFNYAFWEYRQPNRPDDEFCLKMRYSRTLPVARFGRWVDVECRMRFSVVCQIPMPKREEKIKAFYRFK